MPRFLVPVDFSLVSINAALYAVQMAEKMPKKEVILYSITEEVKAGSDGTPVDFDGKAVLEKNLSSLEALQVHLFEMGLSPMEIVAEIGEFPDRIKPTIENHKIDMVVMGSTGNNSYGSLFGSNALEVSRDNTCPVLIVPPSASFKGSSKVAIAVEYSDVDSTVVIEPIRKWLNALNPELHFVYVGAGSEEELSIEQLAEKEKLKQKFNGYSLHFHLIPGKDFSMAINHFVDDNDMDSIIIFPKKHNLFESIFASHHTKKLAYHSHVPVLVVHE